MTVDFSPVVQPVVETAGLILSGCAPLVAILVLRLLHLQGNALAVSLVNVATQEGGALAYTALAAAAHRPADIEIRNAAVAVGVQHVIASAPAALARAGITEQAVADKVVAELGRLLARDPTVPAGPSAIAGA